MKISSVRVGQRDIPCIEFKSVSYFFKIEKNGIKPNTVRWVSANEYALLKDIQETHYLFREETTPHARIKIIDVKTGESFERDIISMEWIGEVGGQHLCVISWRHNQI